MKNLNALKKSKEIIILNTDESITISALIATYGDVNAAIDRLLNSRGQQQGGQQS